MLNLENASGGKISAPTCIKKHKGAVLASFLLFLFVLFKLLLYDKMFFNKISLHKLPSSKSYLYFDRIKLLHFFRLSMFLLLFHITDTGFICLHFFAFHLVSLSHQTFQYPLLTKLFISTHPILDEEAAYP